MAQRRRGRRGSGEEGWEELQLEANRKGRWKRKKGKKKKEGRGRREGKAGQEVEEAEEDAWFRVVGEQEDGATAGTDGLLGLGRVLPDKGAPCSVLRLLW